VEPILQTLAPLVLLIALGSVLAHLRFLGAAFIADLNKLAFWIALPALIFTSASRESAADLQIGRLLAVMIGATLLISLIAWIASYALRLPDHARGTLVQSAFRGNLAYIGVPVLANSLAAQPGAESKHALTTAIVVMVLVMAFYNVLAVIVLQASQHAHQKVKGRGLVRSIATNPLLLAGLVGLIVPLLHLTLPGFVNQALVSLGDAAIPLALLCIGGSLVMSPLQGKLSGIIAAALLKTAVLPLLVLVIGRLAGLDALENHIALVLAACPTAAASFVMARQMGGDEALASGSIALSTLLSGLSLAVALWASP
jgi:predicted permease